MRRVRFTKLGLLAMVGVVPLTALWGCKGDEEALRKSLDDAGNKLVQCRKESNELKNQVASLKRQVAQALANPGHIQLTDPEIINLVANLRGVPAGDPNLLGKGALDPKEASKIVMRGAPALVQCYERALKKNAALQMQAGKEVTLELTVTPQGSVSAVEVKPSPDAEMTTCIRTTAGRWKFPTFQGEPVVLQQKLTLRPQT